MTFSFSVKQLAADLDAINNGTYTQREKLYLCRKCADSLRVRSARAIIGNAPHPSSNEMECDICGCSGKLFVCFD